MLGWLALLLVNCAQSEVLTTPRLELEVVNTVGETTLKIGEIEGEGAATLVIVWVNEFETPVGFESGRVSDSGLVSTHRLGITTLTRTIHLSEEDGLAFLHVRADQPGAVRFTVRFQTEAEVEMQGRNGILLKGEGLRAQAYVIPFESDVTDDGKGMISLVGEGEALVILDFQGEPNAVMSNPFLKLGEKYDAGHVPPSPHIIWEALKERGKLP